MKPDSVSPKPTRLAAAAGLLLVLMLASCRTPNITEITAHGSSVNLPVRAAAPATITVKIAENGADIDSRRLYLTRVRPEGGADGSVTLVPGPVNGAVSDHVATVPATGGTVTFQPAERWRAKASVRYYTPFGTPTTAKEFEFDVIEPLNRFDFLDATASPRWALNGYYKNDAGPAVAPITLEDFPAENYPQPLAGDHAIGFRIRAFNVSGWNPNNDFWSAEFGSPALYGQNAVGGWVGVRTYQVQVRTNASGLRLQPMLTFMRTEMGPGEGHISRWRMVDSGGNGVFFPLADDDAWHTYTVDFTNAGLPPGHVLQLHLRVFGRPGDLPGNDGKHVLIDQFARQ